MVDDNHENTLCHVTGSYRHKPYQHPEMSAISTGVRKLLPQKYMYDNSNMKQITLIIFLLIMDENL